jgi:hypothetical protein
MTGNQHKSPRRSIMRYLDTARAALRDAAVERARDFDVYAGLVAAAGLNIAAARDLMAAAPASTRRRWACGR